MSIRSLRFVSLEEEDEPTNSLKVVVVGDAGSGKTCMMIRLNCRQFPNDPEPNVYDNFPVDVVFGAEGAEDEVVVRLHVWDTAHGHEDFDRLRPLSYPETNVVLICFNIAEPSRETLKHVESFWIPEIRKHLDPSTPFVLAGLRKDLREIGSDELRAGCVTVEEGQELAKRIGAFEDAYFECCSRGDEAQESTDAVFVAVARAGMAKKSSTKKCCVM